MKFKTIFLLFNIIIVISFVFIFFMPVFMLGADYGITFWQKNWPLAIFFVLILAAFNGFFLSNWQVFSLIEAERWDELNKVLAIRLFGKRQFTKRHVRLYVNASLLRADSAAIDRLQAALQEHKPILLQREATLFGTAWLLRNDPAGAEAFLTRWLDKPAVDNKDWLHFYYAFSLIMQQRAAAATPTLEGLLNSREKVLVLLAAYLVGSLCALSTLEPAERQRLQARAEAVRVALAAVFTAERWSRETERAKAEVHVVVLTKLIDEAGAWMFRSRQPDQPSTADSLPTAEAR